MLHLRCCVVPQCHRPPPVTARIPPAVLHQLFSSDHTLTPRFVKYFGTGVIIATAFMHLLSPAFDALHSPCLHGTWTVYDWAPAIALISCLLLFYAEVAAYRIGTKKLAGLGIDYSSHMHDDTDAHAHDHNANQPRPSGVSNPAHIHPDALAHEEEHAHHPDNGHGLGHHGAAADGPTERDIYGAAPPKGEKKDVEAGSDASSLTLGPSDIEATAQIVGVAILEFGIVVHSVIIGLTLAMSDGFVVLFIVIIFHQMFEGLGLGARLASLVLPRRLWWVRYTAAFLYAICTPVGMAAGLGVKQAYNGNSVANLIVSGVLNAISAGILLYSGLVELLAHEILLNPRMMRSSNGRLAYVFICIALGAGLMALLARWA